MRVFIETQKMPRSFYILMAVGLITPLVIILSSYTKATTEVEKNELLFVTSLIIISEALALWLISSTYQFVEINEKGIFFSYPPFKRKKVHIAMRDIESYSEEDYNFPNYGYKVGAWNIFRATPSITMMGLKKVLKIKYQNGKVILIGTKKPVEALKTLSYYRENEVY